MTEQKPAILYSTTSSTIVAVDLAKANDEEWRACDEAVSRAFEQGVRNMLIIADGPGPTSVQRRAMKDKAWFGALRFGVVSSSPVVRTICTVGSWIMPNLHAFAPNEIEQAFERLSIPADERPRILDEIASMRARILGGPNADPKAYRLNG